MHLVEHWPVQPWLAFEPEVPGWRSCQGTQSHDQHQQVVQQFDQMSNVELLSLLVRVAAGLKSQVWPCDSAAWSAFDCLGDYQIWRVWSFARLAAT